MKIIPLFSGALYTASLSGKENWDVMMEAIHSETQSSEASLSYTIITEVAEFKETEAETLQPPLHETVDPEALDALFVDGPEKDRRGKISFVYSGCRIVVETDGQVHVRDVDDSPAVNV